MVSPALVSAVNASLSALTLLSQIALGCFFLYMLLRLFAKFNFAESMLKSSMKNASWLAFIVAAVATSGSLYFSMIAGYEPCELCWYQRIFMYPMVLILLIALVKKGKVFEYTLALSSLGICVSIYNLYIKYFAAASVCSITGPSCAMSYFTYFGYIDITFMAFTAFLILIVLSLLGIKKK